MNKRSIHTLGGYHEAIAEWITGLVAFQVQENANAEFKAAVSIPLNGVIVMLIITVNTIFYGLNSKNLNENKSLFL